MRDIIKHSWVRCATGQHSWWSDSLLAGKYKIFESEWRGTMLETGKQEQEKATNKYSAKSPQANRGRKKKKTLLNQTEWPSCWPRQEQRQNWKKVTKPPWAKSRICPRENWNCTNQLQIPNRDWQAGKRNGPTLKAASATASIKAKYPAGLKKRRSKVEGQKNREKQKESRENVYASIEFNALVTFDHSLTAQTAQASGQCRRLSPDGLPDGLRLRLRLRHHCVSHSACSIRIWLRPLS